MHSRTYALDCTPQCSSALCVVLPVHPAASAKARSLVRADMEMTMTPDVVNTLEKQGRGQEWATGLISVGHEAPVAVSGSNMGQGQPTGKVLSFEQSAPILRYGFHAGDRG